MSRRLLLGAGGAAVAVARHRGPRVTWSPADKSSLVTLSNGNLTAQGGDSLFRLVRATLGRSVGKYYFEVFTGPSIYPPSMRNAIGVSASSVSVDDQMSNSNFWAMSLFDNTLGDPPKEVLKHNASSTAYGADVSLPNNTLGVAVDLDAGAIEFFIKNVSRGVAFTNLSGTLFPTAALANAQSIARFRNAAFTYAPPVGYSAWGP